MKAVANGVVNDDADVVHSLDRDAHHRKRSADAIGVDERPGPRGLRRPRASRPMAARRTGRLKALLDAHCDGESVCKRDSVVTFVTGGHPSLRSTRGLPACAGERAARALCSTLLRMGFTEPCGSPRTLVRSYRTVSPLPVAVVIAHLGPSAVSLCCTSVRSPRPGSRQHPALWSPDFPRPVRARTRSRRGHPADSPSRTSV